MFLACLAFIRFSRPKKHLNRFATLVLAVLLAVGTPLYAAENSNIVPCNIKLVFGVDDSGMSVVSYDLEMQVNNEQGRTIYGVSVHWLNEQAEVIGNSDAACGAKHAGVKLSESGSCRRTIQKIGGRLLEQIGQETWTNIINSQMHNFRDVRYCTIIGYRFGKPAVNRY